MSFLRALFGTPTPAPVTYDANSNEDQLQVRVASCPVCQHVCRPRTKGMNAWDCVNSHMKAIADNGCAHHRAARQALEQHRGRFSCPVCPASFSMLSEALAHVATSTDA